MNVFVMNISCESGYNKSYLVECLTTKMNATKQQSS